MKQVKVKGFYSDLGKIELPHSQSIPSIGLTNENIAHIPFGSKVEITISYDENDFLSGNNGIVWGSYDPKQIEVVKNALTAQNIITDIETKFLVNRKIQLLIVKDRKDIPGVINFIWRSNAGLCLKPDWTYPDATINLSFEQWLEGN
jgi:hypothetical protein